MVCRRFRYRPKTPWVPHEVNLAEAETQNQQWPTGFCFLLAEHSAAGQIRPGSTNSRPSGKGNSKPTGVRKMMFFACHLFCCRQTTPGVDKRRPSIRGNSKPAVVDRMLFLCRRTFCYRAVTPGVRRTSTFHSRKLKIGFFSPDLLLPAKDARDPQ